MAVSRFLIGVQGRLSKLGVKHESSRQLSLFVDSSHHRTCGLSTQRTYIELNHFIGHRSSTLGIPTKKPLRSERISVLFGHLLPALAQVFFY